MGTTWGPLGFPSPPGPGPQHFVVCRIVGGQTWYLNWMPSIGEYAWTAGRYSVYTREAADKQADTVKGGGKVWVEPAAMSIKPDMKRHPASGF